MLTNCYFEFSNEFSGSLGLDGFVLEDEEFLSGDFNAEHDDIKELEADNYEDQLSQPEVWKMNVHSPLLIFFQSID